MWCLVRAISHEVTTEPRPLKREATTTYLSYGRLKYICIGSEVLTAVVMKSSIFWDITPCRPLEVNRGYGGTCRLHLQGWRTIQERNHRGKQMVNSSILNTGVICSSEMSADFQWISRRYIPENITLFWVYLFETENVSCIVYYRKGSSIFINITIAVRNSGTHKFQMRFEVLTAVCLLWCDAV
jgi:hypothetical protein